MSRPFSSRDPRPALGLALVTLGLVAYVMLTLVGIAAVARADLRRKRPAAAGAGRARVAG